MTDQTTTELHGCYEMSNEDYHSGPGISKSHLDKVADCPLNYWNHYLNPEREPAPQSAALVFGSAFHTATLEPDLFASEYLIMPEFNLRSPTGRAARDEWLENEAKGRTVLTVDQRDLALKMASVVHKHPVASQLLRGKKEQSFYAKDPETGLLVKCRTDNFDEHRGLVADLKSTDDASPDSFAKSIANFRYHVQQAWYEDVFSALYGDAPDYFVFVAVDKTPPHPIGVYYIDPEDVSLGRQLARRDLRTILQCRQTGVWPDYTPTQVQQIGLPGWARHQQIASLGDDA